MKYLFVCCEGDTEEAFVVRVLAPYFKDTKWHRDSAANWHRENDGRMCSL